MHRILTFTILFYLFSISAFAQDKLIADSLLKVLKTAQDTQRVAVLNSLSFHTRIAKPDTALLLANEAVALAQELNYMVFECYMQKGLVYYNVSKHDSAIKYFELALPIAVAEDDPKKLSAIYSNLGNAYGDIGLLKKCLSYYMMSSRYTQNSEPWKAVYLEVNIGTIYSALDRHDSALVFYENALRRMLELDSTDEKLYIVYGNIGSTLLELMDTAKAETAYTKSHYYAVKYDNPRALASSYDHLAIIEAWKGNRDTALAYFRKALAYCSQIESGASVAETALHLGATMLEFGMHDSAMHYLRMGLGIAEEIRDYYTLDEYYRAISEVYEQTGRYDSALVYHKKLYHVRDSLFELNRSSLLSEMEVERESERRHQEIELLKEKDEKKSLILYSSIALAVLVFALGIVAFSRYLQKKRSALILQKQKDEIEEQKEIIEEKNKDITDSIRYAKRIQNAILPSDEKMNRVFPQSWCCFIPKDIVSGDFYWFEQEGDYKLFAVVDCTGHGVPGALLSVVGHNILGKALTDLKLVMPDKILAFLDQEIHRILRHRNTDDESGVQDGMDVALCCYHEKSGTIYYSGAFNPMYIIRKGELNEYKSDKILIGSGGSSQSGFKLHEVKVEKGDEIILFSDGFADQFGGPFGKKMKYKPFKDLLTSVSNREMHEQIQFISRSFEEWRKNYDQVDDVCVVAVRL